MPRRETETWSVLSGISTIHEANMKYPYSEQNRTLQNLPMEICFEILDAWKQSCTQSYNPFWLKILLC